MMSSLIKGFLGAGRKEERVSESVLADDGFGGGLMGAEDILCLPVFLFLVLTSLVFTAAKGLLCARASDS